MGYIENKFAVISVDWIVNYIDRLYEPYKIYGFVTKIPKYSFTSESYDGQLKMWAEIGDIRYVIYNPTPDEISKIKDFRAFEAIRKKLLALRHLQMKYSNNKLTENEANDIENQIDLIIDEVFGNNETGNKNENKEISVRDLFSKSEYFDEIKNWLLDRSYIRINDDKIEWLGDIEQPNLQSKKLLCILFVVLEDKNYLKPKPSNASVIRAISKEFNVSISERTYGKAKSDYAYVIDNTKDKDYIDSYHFIPKK